MVAVHSWGCLDVCCVKTISHWVIAWLVDGCYSFLTGSAWADGRWNKSAALGPIVHVADFVYVTNPKLAQLIT